MKMWQHYTNKCKW